MRPLSTVASLSTGGGSSAVGQGQAEVDALLGMDDGKEAGIELGKVGSGTSGSSGVVVV